MTRIPLPDLGQQVLLKSLIVVYGSDILLRTRVPVSTILGHEMLGNIVAFGPGDRVKSLFNP